MESASTQVSARRAPGDTSDDAPVGLALDVENGQGVPVKLAAGQTFFINQIDLRASMNTSVDEGVSGLARTGDFAHLDWEGVNSTEQDFGLLANPDGTYTRHRFYRGAKWMDVPSQIAFRQLDANGRPIGHTIVLHIGREDAEHENDAFFLRRLRAIQWTNDCVSRTDCTGAESYMEEGLVELRYALDRDHTFRLDPRTAALELRWSLHPGAYRIPVTQVQQPEFAYGFQIGLDAVTPPRADGTYAAGTDVTFEVTPKDGEGHRLYSKGSLPTYDDVEFGSDPGGIQYYRAFFDPTLLYWRRKARERNFIIEILGPAQDVKPIYSVVQIPELLGKPVQDIASQARDGVFSQFATFPPTPDLFGGAFDPTHAGWARPVSDEVTFSLPDDAVPGTYYVTVKAVRDYLGEDSFATTTKEIQVGTTQHTATKLSVGGCWACHSGTTALDHILHGNSNLATCSGCHAPLAIELSGPIPVRIHYIHSHSGRFDAPLTQCSTCHKTVASIQRVSKAACLSCHRSYPDWHVAKFGKLNNIYVGTESDAFKQCTTTCHQNHPGSGLKD